MDFRVYLGGYQPHPEVLYLKAGMTGNLKSRINSYGGVLPGGMTFMWAAIVSSRGDALRGETELMRSLEYHGGFTPVSGEWFSCDPFLKSVAIDELFKIGTRRIEVRCTHVKPFSSGKRGRRNEG